MILASDHPLVIGSWNYGTIAGPHPELVEKAPFVVLREVTREDWVEGLMDVGVLPAQIMEQEQLAKGTTLFFYEISLD